VVVVGATGLELVYHGVLPGKQFLNQIDGACSVPATALSFETVGPSESGRFYSEARHRSVGYTIAYPPAHRPGDSLALVVMLHGYGNNHATALFGMSPLKRWLFESMTHCSRPWPWSPSMEVTGTGIRIRETTHGDGGS